MRIHQCAILLLASTIGTLTGCADFDKWKPQISGPSFASVSSSLPPISSGNGRIYFYRENVRLADGVSPAIQIDGRVVGRAIVNTTFFIDLPPGRYVVSVTRHRLPRMINVQMAAGDIRYITVNVPWNPLAGPEASTPVEVPQSTAVTKMAELVYVDQPLKIASIVPESTIPEEAAGAPIEVFGPIPGKPSNSHQQQGGQVVSGSPKLPAISNTGNPATPGNAKPTTSGAATSTTVTTPRGSQGSQLPKTVQPSSTASQPSGKPATVVSSTTQPSKPVSVPTAQQSPAPTTPSMSSVSFQSSSQIDGSTKIYTLTVANTGNIPINCSSFVQYQDGDGNSLSGQLVINQISPGQSGSSYISVMTAPLSVLNSPQVTCSG
ncbi:DUF2846 domain-containing protein [Paraburkholderia sediminicola]|uniref:DUF2846 domain-containing protein n=1 Tax=Paraburkholderia sediminicola TaxID=458836 RepID=UPI0038BCC3E4